LGYGVDAALEDGALRAGGARGMSARHLAQFNIARIRYPLDDPRMAEFVDNVARVNKLAEQIEGFVWRLQDTSGHAMNMRVYDDPAILPNLTLWENAEALERFVWQTVHGRFYRRREDWFEKIGTPMVLWWVPAGERPTLADGVARLDHMKVRGPSDHAFGWESLTGARLWKTQRVVKTNGRAAPDGLAPSVAAAAP
jgi:hypothetical protein